MMDVQGQIIAYCSEENISDISKEVRWVTAQKNNFAKVLVRNPWNKTVFFFFFL